MDDLKMKATLSDQEQETLCRAYNIDIRSHRRFELGLRSNVFYLETDRGSLAVKRYGEMLRADPRIIQGQVDVQEFLFDRGTPVARPYRDSDGQLIHESEGQAYTLMDFLEGEHPDFGGDGILCALEAMALFNRAAVRFTKPIVTFKKSGDLPAQYEDLQKYLPTTPSDGFDEYVLCHVDFLEQELHRTLDELRRSPLPNQLIHGDMNVGSILVDPATSGVVGIVDFDHVHYAPRIKEFVNALSLAVCDEMTEGLDASERIDMPRYRWLLEEYAKFGPAENDQFDSIPLYLRISGLEATMITWKGGYAGNAQQRTYFESRYKRFVHRIQIADVLSKMDHP